MQAPDAGHPGQRVGLVMAAAMTPPTLAPSLSHRSWQDQGIITGLSTGSHYLMTLAAQDVIDVGAGLLARSGPFPVAWSDDQRRSVAALFSEIGAVPLGLGLAAYLDRAGVTSPTGGAVRQAAWRLGTTALCGCVLIGTTTAARSLDRALGAGGRVANLPLSIPVGMLTAAIIERARAAVPEPTAAGSVPTTASDTASPLADDVPTVPGLAAGAAVIGLLWGAGWVEGWTADQVRRLAPGPVAGSGLVWRLTSHAAFAAVAGFGVNALWSRAMQKIEAGSTDVDPWMKAAPGLWTHPMISGDPASLITWDSLGREGRRHAVTFVRPEVVVDPPPLPDGRRPEDLSIPTVMGEPATVHPVQVFVGLDSAATPTERVELAIAEMDRTDAWSRSMLMLVSPTGTGYVNYVAVAAAQYLTRGDIASITMQYSKRPSPLSLGRIRDAREQNRLLWLRILQRVRTMPPDRRPKVVLFGESLGAHTSQDVLLGWGTLGPQALGIDRALWIGTPAGSKWAREITGPARPDVDPSLVAVVNDYEQFRQLDDGARAAVRYLLLSHDNDGVTRFGLDLLSRRPDWLGPNRPRTEEVPGRSPRGIPATMRWRPVTTFFQTLVDMKNAQVAGSYAAWGHDYRADLPEFVRDVYDLECTEEQLQRVRDAVRRREEFREKVFD